MRGVARARVSLLLLAVGSATAFAAAACASFGSSDDSPPAAILDEAGSALDSEADGASSADGNTSADAGHQEDADAACPQPPVPGASLICAGSPCGAPKSICCSGEDGGMLCTVGGIACGVAATHRTRSCGSRSHCQGGQGHCCASALTISNTTACPLTATNADSEGFGSACEAAGCAPSLELCAAGDSCGGGMACVAVSVDVDGLPGTVGVCRSIQ
jgi:hypothetical protein